MNSLNIFFLACGFTLVAVVARSESDGAHDLSFRSELWPEYVVIKNDYTWNDHGRERVISAGTRGVLVRIENGNAMVDFGTSGVHLVDILGTDIDERNLEDRNTKSWEKPGRITTQLSNKLIWPDSKLRVEQEYVTGLDYVLICYMDVGSDAAHTAMSGLNEIYSGLVDQYTSLGFITIPTNEDSLAVVEQLSGEYSAWPLMVPYLSLSYTHAFQHAMEAPAAVLIDKNGRVLMKFDSASLKDGEALRAEIVAELNLDTDRRSRG